MSVRDAGNQDGAVEHDPGDGRGDHAREKHNLRQDHELTLFECADRSRLISRTDCMHGGARWPLSIVPTESADAATFGPFRVEAGHHRLVRSDGSQSPAGARGFCPPPINR